MDKNEEGPQAKGGIGHIERGPMIGTPIDVQEVGHLSKTHSIYQIPQSASKEERISCEQAPVHIVRKEHEAEKKDERSHRNEDEEQRTELPFGPGHESEGCSGVAGMNEICQTGDDFDDPTQRYPGGHQMLGDLIRSLPSGRQ